MLSDNSFKSNSLYEKRVNFNYFCTKSFEDTSSPGDHAWKGRSSKKQIRKENGVLSHLDYIEMSKSQKFGNYKHSYFRREKLITIK